MPGQMHSGDYGTSSNVTQGGTPVELDNRSQADPVMGQKQDISDVLQQIMTITDQSLDEAQARYSYHRVIIICKGLPKSI